MISFHKYCISVICQYGGRSFQQDSDRKKREFVVSFVLILLPLCLLFQMGFILSVFVALVSMLSQSPLVCGQWVLPCIIIA